MQELLGRIADAHGVTIALIGIGTVFAALVTIWLFTEVFSRVFRRFSADAPDIENGQRPAVVESEVMAAAPSEKPREDESSPGDPLEAHVAAIAVALEIRRRNKAAARPEGRPASAWKLQGRLSQMSNLPR